MNNDLKQLEKIESEIRSGIQLVGRGLIEVQTKKLYKLKHETFEEYCQQEWGFSRQHCYTLIENHRVSERLSTIVDKPLPGKQLEQLAKLPARDQAQVAAEVLAACEEEGRKPTAKDFAKAVKTRAVDAVLEIPVSATATEHDEEEYEDADDDEEDEPTIEDHIETGRQAAQEILNAINQVMRLIKAVPDGVGTTALFHKAKTICRDLEMAKGGVMNCMPYAVCPRCQGSPDGCSACGNHGWITKLASVELKG
jgi:hypothetical protein